MQATGAPSWATIAYDTPKFALTCGPPDGASAGYRLSESTGPGYTHSRMRQGSNGTWWTSRSTTGYTHSRMRQGSQSRAQIVPVAPPRPVYTVAHHSTPQHTQVHSCQRDGTQEQPDCPAYRQVSAVGALRLSDAQERPIRTIYIARPDGHSCHLYVRQRRRHSSGRRMRKPLSMLCTAARYISCAL
jgi:hypothetical protein